MKIMILNDGETWTDLEGCKIVDAPNSESVEAMKSGGTPRGQLIGRFDQSGTFIVEPYKLMSVTSRRAT